jgi:glycosyltransferase involved in cell wall biosynthesis
LGLSAEEPVVGFVGRLTAVKDPILFLEAARLVYQQMPNVRFCIVGDGELRASVERQVEALGLTRCVHVVGWKQDMPAVYAGLDVLALSSRNEGTPVTAIEALAAGVPVVGTRVGGMADVVRDGETGLLVPAGDARALAAGIADLIRLPERARRLAEAGRDDVLCRYSRERLIADMESLYLLLLKEKGVCPW